MGPVVPGYDVVAEIGRGDASVVYVARRLDLGGRWVALKVIDVPESDAASLERFNEERMTRAAVSGHPALLTVYSSGRTAAGQPYLVVELMAGSLGAWLERHGPMAWSDAAQVGVTLAEALAELHGAALLHRAVTPDKVWYDRAGRVALDAFSLTPQQATVAPEVAAGEDHGTAGDVFGLGSTLYHLITGAAPPPMNPAPDTVPGADPASRDPGEVGVEVPDDGAGELTAAQVPEPLVSLLGRCQEPDPHLRPDLPTVLAELVGLLNGVPSPHRLPVDATTLPSWLPPDEPDTGPPPPLPASPAAAESLDPPADLHAPSAASRFERPTRPEAIGAATPDLLPPEPTQPTGPSGPSGPTGPTDDAVAAPFPGTKPRRRGPRPALLAAAAVLSAAAILIGLVVAGGKDRTSGAAATPTTPDTDAMTLPAGTGPTMPTSMEGWEELWRQERAAIVANIRTGGYGLAADGKSALISENYRIDLTACPQGWNNAGGLSATAIRIGVHGTSYPPDSPAPSAELLRQGFVALGPLQEGLRRYFEPEDRRNIIDDTGASRAVETVSYGVLGGNALSSLAGVEDVLGMVTMSDTTRDYNQDDLNRRCLPHPLALSSQPGLGDPLGHPWSTGLYRAMHTEGMLWGQLIEQQAAQWRGSDGRITVAGFVIDGELGRAYEAGFLSWLANSPLSAELDYRPAVLEPAAPAIVDWSGLFAEIAPDVFITMGAGTFCEQSVHEARGGRVEQTASLRLLPWACRGFFGEPLPDGTTTWPEGWMMVGDGTERLDDAAAAGNAWAADTLTRLGEADPAAADATARLGWTLEQVLRIAAELDGGLSRVNLMVALRDLNMTAPFLHEGLSFRLHGAEDAFLIEGGEVLRFDTASERFEPIGQLLQLAGPPPPCAWDGQQRVCR
ncbi:MAG: protein kinase domain-containing protein [Acidimicrobiales bacterium]